MLLKQWFCKTKVISITYECTITSSASVICLHCIELLKQRVAQVLIYAASGTDITHSEFTEQTWVPWIEIWIMPESAPIFLWKLQKSEIVHECVLIFFAHCGQSNIPNYQPSHDPHESHVNRLPNWRHNFCHCWKIFLQGVFIPQYMSTAKGQRCPNLDKLQHNFVKILEKKANLLEPKHLRICPNANYHWVIIYYYHYYH